MNTKVIEGLASLGVYTLNEISEEEYNRSSKDNKSESLIYLQGHHEGGNDKSNKYYAQVCTHGIPIEEARLQLEVIRTKNIKSIKKMVQFFFILTIISLILSFIGGIMIYNDWVEFCDKLNRLTHSYY